MKRSAFFVQNNYVERLTAPVAMYARDNGLALEDRSSYSGLDVDNCGIDWSMYDVVLPYGSVQFISRVKESSLARFVLHVEAMFAASEWAPRFGRDALNSAGCVVRAGDVAARLRELGAAHLRPDCIDKAFSGDVFDEERWAVVRRERAIAEDVTCWVSPVQTIEAEWRCWIIDGRVIEVSQYRGNGQMVVRRDGDTVVRSAAAALASIYLPAPCVVMDMARVAGRYAVVEFNPIHCAGWYGVDIPAVLSAWMCSAESRRSTNRGVC